MSLNFPNSPSTNDTHVTGGSTWIFNGEMWVRQGTRGAQGLQGLQGNQGTQGLQGISNQGVQGNQGLQGRQGTQGLTGAFGGATFTYGFLTDTANSDPGTGNVKFNNSNLSSATTLFIDDEDDNGTDIQSYLRTIDDSTSGIKGHFKIADLANPDDFALFTITASSTEESGYFSIPVSYVSGSATSFSNGENLTVTFARTGDKGDTGIQGLQGLQGNQGVQGLSNQGVQGLQGLQGLQGNQGVQGAQGLQGNQGTQGLQGLQGNQGVQGLQGTQGNQGTQGLQGNQGTQGLQGNQGVQGLSNQGVQGLQGLQGIHSRVAISTESPSPADVGDFWYDSDDSALFIYYDSNNDGTGDQWIEIGAGPTGAQGTQGTQGLQGHQGLQGNQGVQGTQGLQGLQGNQGTQGHQGLQGNQGVQGLQGLQGNQGLQGLQGNQGTQGTQGLQGNQGVQGLQGLQGNQGVQGVQGNQGTQGTQGTQGLQGLQGLQGNQGTQGTQGLQGNQGLQGLQGLQGNQGVQGLQGMSNQGVQGNQGLQGLQGNQGVQGLQGLSNQGVQGLQGRQGTQGLTGAFGGATFSYDFSTNTSGSSDPGAGKLKVNNANLTSATLLLLDDVDENGTDIQAFLRTIDDSTSTLKGHVKVSSAVQPDNFVIYTISATSEQTGFHSVSVSYVSGSVTSFTDGQDIVATFARTGDKGDTGSQGVQGLANQGVQGLQGLQGIHSRVAISTEAPTPADVGDFWYDNDDSSLFIYYDSNQDGTGDQWIEIGAGPTGAQGTQGTQGLQGLQGNQGVQGTQGLQGLQGNQGTQGHQGLQGNQGVQGAQGTQGRQGLQGVQGNQGLQGLQGNQGVQGLQGNQGTQGTQGTQGNQGTQGAQGTQGTQGLQGLQGNQGLQGLQGVQGTQGTQGLQGLSGSDSYGINYTFDSSTSTPGSGGLSGGLFRFSIDWLNGSLGSAYNAYVSEADNDGIGIAGLLDTLDDSSSTNKALIVLYKKNTMTVNAKFYVTGMTDNGGWRTLDIEYIDRDGWVNISNGDDVFMSISIIGDRGSQGHQGVQGVQGLQGLSNQGVQGTQGLQGRQGTQGLTGAFGGATFSYDFNTDTSSTTDPGAGKLKFNNSNLTSATLLLLDDVDENGTDIQTFLRTIDDSTSTIKGHVKVSSSVQPDDFVIYTISSTSELSGQTFHSVSVSYVSGSVTSFSNGQDLVATFARTGDKGDTGNQGVQGLSNQGTQGLQGLQGIHSRVAISTESPTPADVGDFWYDNDDSALFIYYDSDNDGNGDQWIEIGAGPTGAQGTQGTQSTQGTQGRQGTQGTLGRQGTQGTQGLQGLQGHQGLQGNQGVQGAQGTQGRQGLQGNQGTQGTQGAQGTQGRQGVQGRDGQNAGQGTQGVQGSTGTAAGGATGVDYDDNVKVRFGDGQDLQIFHNGSESVIHDAGTGQLKVRTDLFRINNAADSETLATFSNAGNVSLYYDNSKKFETTSAGVTVTGTLTATTFSGSGASLTAVDAATLDTLDSTQFLRSDAADFKTSGNLTFNDGINLQCGTDGDLRLFHNGSATFIEQTNTGTGHLNIRQSIDDQDVVIQCDDGTGGTTQYFRADGSTGEAILYHYGDEKIATKSTGIDVTGDLTLTDTDAGSSAGPELKLFRNSASPADADYLGQIKFAGESDTGVERNYAKITGKISDASNGTEDGIIEFAHIKAGSQNISGRWNSTELQLLNGTHLSLGDSQEIRVGASDDLKIYHDGTDSYIKDAGTGRLLINTSGFRVNSAGNTENMITAEVNGAVELYYDNSKKLETKSDGVLVSGELQATTLDINGNVDIDDGQVVFFATDNKMRWADDAKATFGHGDDLQLFHNGANSVIDGGGTGSLFFLASTYRFRNANDTEEVAKFTENGSVELYYDSNKKFETTSDGAKITGGLQDKDGDLGTSGQVLSSTGTQLNWVDADSGPQGVQGLQGLQGNQGVQGLQGLKGNNGSNGSQGIAGSDGTNGSNGSNGAQGTQGSAGSNGSNGSNGAQGTAGTQGAIGPDGGNAGTLDNLDSTSFLRSDATDVFDCNGNSLQFDFDNAGRNSLVFTLDGSSRWQLVHDNSGNNLNFTRIAGGGQMTINGSRILTIGDEGSGNGIDADTVDGIEASSFLRSNANDSASGQITLSGGLNMNGKDVYTGNGALISNDSAGAFADRSGSNIDHLWHNDSTNTWNFCSDTTYKNTGNSAINCGNITSSGTVTANSDIKLKKNINTIDNALDKVLNLRGVEFDYIESGEHNIGVIAQEVEKVLPDLIHTSEDTDIKSVAYGNLTAVLIEAVKELNKENDALSARIKSLEDR